MEVLEDVIKRLFYFFGIAECAVDGVNSLQMCSQVTVSCSQPVLSGLLMSCQTVDWIYRGVLVSSGPSPVTSEQGFGFLVCGGGQGLQLFAPRPGQAICSFHFLESHSGPGLTVGPRCILVGGLLAVGGIAGQRYWRLGTEGLLQSL